MKLLLHCKKFSKEISEQIIEFVDNLTKSRHDIFFTKKFSDEINRQTSKYNISVINKVGIAEVSLMDVFPKNSPVSTWNADTPLSPDANMASPVWTTASTRA